MKCMYYKRINEMVEIHGYWLGGYIYTCAPKINPGARIAMLNNTAILFDK